MPELRKFEDLPEAERESFLDYLDDGIEKDVAQQVAAKRAKAKATPTPVA